MDWLDQYLNELNRPGTVVHLPPDKQSWNRPNPTKQQLSLIQDATVADMVRMRNIQEARQAEMDAGMGGGYDAGSAAKERTTVSPSVIPVSTTSLLINGGAAGPTNTFAKATGNTDIYICNYQIGSSDPTTKYTFNHLWRSSTSNGGDQWNQARLGVATRKYEYGDGYTFISGSNCSGETTVSVSPTWVLFFEASDEYGPFMSTYATNPSQDFNYIPTTGWVIHGDLSSVTITAA